MINNSYVDIKEKKFTTKCNDLAHILAMKMKAIQKPENQ